LTEQCESVRGSVYLVSDLYTRLSPSFATDLAIYANISSGTHQRARARGSTSEQVSRAWFPVSIVPSWDDHHLSCYLSIIEITKRGRKFKGVVFAGISCGNRTAIYPKEVKINLTPGSHRLGLKLSRNDLNGLFARVHTPEHP